jgi:hypothetical protein
VTPFTNSKQELNFNLRYAYDTVFLLMGSTAWQGDKIITEEAQLRSRLLLGRGNSGW